jgi:hypothetical protein
MGKADRIQGAAIERLARLSRLVAVSGCSGPSAVSLRSRESSIEVLNSGRGGRRVAPSVVRLGAKLPMRLVGRSGVVEQ